MTQVAVTEVAVVPTFKGFRSIVTRETDGSAKSASQGFSRAFARTGADTGKKTGAGFKAAFEQSAKGTSSKLTKALEADVAKASRALSAARLREQDAAGKTRVAEAQLAEARKKYASDSSQVIRAQERMESSSRQLSAAHERTEAATDDLKRSQSELARAADHAGDELAQAGQKGVTGFRNNVLTGVKGFAGGLVTAFAALGIGNIVADAFRSAKDFVLGSIDIASDLNESVNAVQVAYGDAADAVLKLGDNSAKAFGLSKRDLNAYATQFSAFIGTIAGEGGDVAGTLETLVGRGTDFASVFNTDVAEALRLFQSGLAGETEPLRKYGIDMSAAAVEAYALANGIGDGVGALTEAEKVQARYGLLLAQTAKVQGDFANTSDELANKNRINAASWDDVQAKIGDAFLPIAQQLATVVGDDLIPIIGELAEEQGPELAKAFADILPDLTELAKELLPQLPGLFKSTADALPAIIGFLGLLAPLLVSGIEGWNGLTTTIGGFFDLISGNTTPEELVEKMVNLQGPIGDTARSFWDAGIQIGEAIGGTIRTVSDGVNGIVGFLSALPTRVVEAIGDLGSILYGSGQALMRGFLGGIQSMFAPIGDAVSGALDWVMGFFPHSPAKRGPLSGSGWADLKKSGNAFWDQWVGGIGGGEGPEFPEFTSAGGSSGTAPGGAPAPGGGGGRSVSQVNHFDKTDPHEAVELANQQWAAMLRGV
ncbi:hypothetical protein AB0E56_13035 [Microbacterium sp. NPDC028030]|uniref:phage tail protein n=1 Tax=Microbacterium sp. NPDC028030 TaxID=3155124 RepID=UPI0034054B51